MNANSLSPPVVVVGALILNPEQKMLLVKGKKWNGLYTVPGGKLEHGETLTQAVQREVEEETGLKVYDVAFVGVQESINDPAYYKPKHFIFVDFICKTTASTVKLNDEGLDYVWATHQQARKLPLSQGTKKLLHTFLMKK